MMRSKGRQPLEAWIALALCAAVFVAGLVELVVPGRPTYAGSLAPEWLPLAAAAIAAGGLAARLRGRGPRTRLAGALTWSGLFLMLWAASGLPLDLLRAVSLIVPGFMPPGIDWMGLATRTLALVALVALARLALSHPVTPARIQGASWYGFAALALALPYPVLKTWWALGGNIGLRWPGADGLAGSFALWLPAVPWLAAAALSVLLVLTPRWFPRRLLVAAGWSATVIVAMIGPVAAWSLVGGVIRGDADFGAMAAWVYGLIYGSWFLWAIAAGAATRAFQLRSGAVSDCSGPDEPRLTA